MKPLGYFLGLASPLVGILFISVPAVLLGGNAQDLIAPRTFFALFVCLAMLLFLLLAISFRFLPFRISKALAALCGAAGLVIYLFDLILPIDIGPIESGTETVSARPVAGLVQIILFGFGTWALVRSDLKKAGIFLGVFSVVFSLMSLPAILFAKGEPSLNTSNKKEEVSIQQIAGSSADYNIYHMLLDGYYGPWLEWSMREMEISPDILSEFVHYPRARSNYPATIPSFASFFSGTLFDPEKMTLNSWHEESARDNIISDLRKAGFKTQVYAVAPRPQFGPSEQIELVESPRLRIVADFWLLRVVPVVLRPHIVDNGSGPFSRLLKVKGAGGDLRGFASYKQFNSLVKDILPRAPRAGQYFHLYFNPPHGPYELNRHGHFVGKSGYLEQLHLATTMIRDLVASLKESGHFEKSLIIIQSDHGSTNGARYYRGGDPLKDTVRVPDGLTDSLAGVDVLFRSGPVTDASFNALLMLKPLKACGKSAPQSLRREIRLTQLLDIRKYLKAVVEDGKNICEFPIAKQVHLFNGLTSQKKNKGGTVYKMGSDLEVGTMNHYQLDDNGEWTIHPNRMMRYR